MSYRKIDPMDQYRKREKLGQLKLIILTFLIFAGWAFLHAVGFNESIQIRQHSIYGISKYILSLMFLILVWFSSIACSHVIRQLYLYLRIRKYINTEIHSIMFHQIIRQIAIAIFWAMLTFYAIDFGCSNVKAINLFYYSTLNLNDDGFLAKVLWFIWMISFFVIHMVCSTYWFAIMGFFNSNEFIFEDQ
jgi:hypothetical protein